MIDLVPGAVADFVLTAHVGQPDAPRFTLRALDSQTTLRIAGITGNVGDQMFAFVCAALVGVANVSIDGKPIVVAPCPVRRIAGAEIPAGSASEDIVRALPASWLTELAAEVQRRLTVGPDDRKN